MINSYDTDVAMDVGINASILYKNIQFWCEKNQTNGQNFYDGYYWTYNSVKAFCIQFPYMSEKQIRSSLNLLEEKGYIISGNYNKSSYDRTKWYADARTEMADSNYPEGQMENAKKANENAPQGEAIPYINTDIKPNREDIIIEKSPKKSRFVPPTLEQVQEYCDERNNDVDAQRFFEYYQAGGWKDAKGNPVKNWKQKVITWERNSNGKPINASSGYKKQGNEFLALLEDMEDGDE